MQRGQNKLTRAHLCCSGPQADEAQGALADAEARAAALEEQLEAAQEEVSSLEAQLIEAKGASAASAGLRKARRAGRPVPPFTVAPSPDLRCVPRLVKAPLFLIECRSPRRPRRGPGSSSKRWPISGLRRAQVM